ncbi:VWA domain-containing protein [Shewanella submarina]|uniref:VWA domain-containing protein n=1 Tax=Shewanella submarina TaxID=2016376 RepID=A0ABV7G9V0_9GAMM|nr:VWA domain-containing protein [Shewanella submarina]MCL1039887.1 VWA domain-containing protein [Shewanella submarina]
MLSLEWPWLLLLLPLPLLIRSKQEEQISGGELTMPGIARTQSQRVKVDRSTIRWFYLLMWAFLVVACARPQWLGEPIDIPTKGRDLMVAVDLSGSMQIEDMALAGRTVDRFSVVQQVVSDFIDQRKGDRLGLILFADHAYLQTPLTADRRSVAQYMREAQIGLVGKQTAIGEAIGLAVKRFEQMEDSNRVLVLLTDGSNNAGNIEPLQAAEIAAERKVTIYTIGVGADVMEQRGFFGTRRVNPSSDLDESTLTDIARITNGQYFRARNPQELQQIYEEINKLQPVSRDEQSYRPRSELFYWPLGVALLVSIGLALSQAGLLNLPAANRSGNGRKAS